MKKIPQRSAWAFWPWERCKARKRRVRGQVYFGRCELRKNHEGAHALERGFDIVWFS